MKLARLDGRPATLAFALALGLFAFACGSPAARSAVASEPVEVQRGPQAASVAPDPSKDEVALGSMSGWDASLVIDNGKTGIWTVKAFKVFPHYGATEIVGLDDFGRCHVLWSYSGKWTPVTAIADGTWLGGLDQGDLDPRIPGSELYTGGKAGNLYQVVAHPNTLLDNRMIARFPGQELHTIVAGEFDPFHAGNELAVFTNLGGLFEMAPRADGMDGFEVLREQRLPGRVRDAVLLPVVPSSPARIATVSRSGSFDILSWNEQGAQDRTIHSAAMGMGRLALRPTGIGEPVVIYTTQDDGMIWRHEELTPGGDWKSEAIYAGHQGPRGVVSGHFDADPAAETIAIFGYSERVELLTRTASGWRAETIFEDRDKGHWITRLEIDGRNGTDEIACSGYGARIVLLSRPPGYGTLGVSIDHTSP